MKKSILNQSQIKSIIKTAIESGEIALRYFRSNDLEIKRKSDDSLVTIADSKISDLIFTNLQKIAPNIPIICEEKQDRDFGNGTFWLIDPIDGTKSFAHDNPEFTINIALIKNQQPIFGLIYAPAILEKPFYYIDENGSLKKYLLEQKKAIDFSFTKINCHNPTIISSKRITNDEILDYFKLERSQNISDKNIKKVSSSLKFIYLIEGKANFYLHLKRSMEWDIAAGHALLEAIGGEIINLDKSKFLYQKENLINKPFLAKNMKPNC